jgi:hypothetical protein
MQFNSVNCKMIMTSLAEGEEANSSSGISTHISFGVSDISALIMAFSLQANKVTRNLL